MIGAGYNNCRDLGFRAVDLFDALSPEIEALSPKPQPKVHEAISDLNSFIETFLYFFEQGSNAEFVSPDRDLFYLLHDRLYGLGATTDRIAVNEELGGHSSVWAIRAQFENCKAYVTPLPSEFNVQNLRRNDLYDG